MLSSLDRVPLRGGELAEHYLAATIERAAALAIALAASAGLLDETDSEPS